MGRHALWAAMLAAGLLTACGGGGGDSTSEPTAANVTLSGTAAKGLMAGATVTAHAVKADGTVDEAVLATDITDAAGAYELVFDATQDQPYVIRVVATADTTHVDELTNTAKPLPAGFTMRSLFVPTSTGAVSVTASITPFSEMAVSAAQKASGGITAVNANQAISTVTQLLGFNPVTVPVVPAASAGTVAQQQMAVMLAAVSQLAADGAVGCDTVAADARIDCVVDALAASASTSSIKLETASGASTTDVSAALAAAVSTVLTNPVAVPASIPANVVASAVQNLACEGSACTAAEATTDTPAITAAKALFAQLSTDIRAVFLGSASAVSGGPVNTEALAFKAAMEDVQVPAEVLVTDLSALIKGADLYNDFKAGRWTSNSRGHAAGTVPTSTPGMIGGYGSVGCTVYQDAETKIAATAPANANYAACRASYYVTSVNGVRTAWRHGFTLTPTGTNSFAYTTTAQVRVEHWDSSLNGGSGGWVFASNTFPQGQTQGYEGTLTAGTDTDGHITSFAVAGELPGAFASGGTTIVNDHHTWNLQGTRTISGFKQEVSTLSGTLVAYADATTKAGTLKVNGFKSREIPMTDDMARPTASDPATQGDIAEIELDLVWTTATAEFAGALKAIDSKWDASGNYHMPTDISLSGSLRNIAGGQASEFAAGTFTTKVTGYEAFNELASSTPSNQYGVEASFVGAITAPNRPKLEVTVSGSGNHHDSANTSMTMQYRTLANGTPRTVVAISHSTATDGSDVFTLSEAASGLSLEWNSGATSAELKHGSAVIGTLDRASKNLTFTDGSHVSLDLGF